MYRYASARPGSQQWKSPMPELNTRSRTTAGMAEPLSPVKENRIDPPHAMANGRETAAAEVEKKDDVAAAGDAEGEVASLAMVQQLRLQAQQLSHHLSEQQQDLDRREAELQARAAQLEQQDATTGYGSRRHEELSDREAALAAREHELTQCKEQIDQFERTVAQRRRDSEKELQTWREALERREAAAREAEEQTRVCAIDVEAAAVALKDAGQVHEELVADLERRASQFNARRSVTFEMIERFLAGEQVLQARPKHSPRGAAATYVADRRLSNEDGDRMLAGQPLRDEFDELAELLGKLQTRRAHLSEAESLLARGKRGRRAAAIAFERASTVGRRTARRAAAKRVAAATRRRRARAAQEALEAASQQLELAAAVEQMRAELTIAQREALENRLAAEELFAQLAGAIPPAQLSHQIARSRAHLTECYRLQQEGIIDERRQLESLAVQITEQHGRLAAQKRNLERWLQERAVEAEAETARLAEREKQLDRQRDRMEKQRYDYEHERQEYQHQIRRLLAELGR